MHQHTWTYAAAQEPLEAIRHKGKDIPATGGWALCFCNCGAVLQVQEGETVEQAAVRMHLAPPVMGDAYTVILRTAEPDAQILVMRERAETPAEAISIAQGRCARADSGLTDEQWSAMGGDARASRKARYFVTACFPGHHNDVKP